VYNIFRKIYSLNNRLISIKKIKKISCSILYLINLKIYKIKHSIKDLPKFDKGENYQIFKITFSEEEKNKNNIEGRSLSLGNKFVHEYGTFLEHNTRLNFSPAGLLSEYNTMSNR
jgi:hypothetical protein